MMWTYRGLRNTVGALYS